jgi:hypothetical protein
MKYNNLNFKICPEDGYVELEGKLFYLSLEKCISSNISRINYSNNRGEVEFFDKINNNEVVFNSDSFDHIVDLALSIGSKYDSLTTINKLNQVYNFEKFTICRGIEKGSFTREFNIKSRFNSHYVYITQGNAIAKEVGLSLNEGTMYHVRNTFNKSIVFEVHNSVQWISFNPVDIDQEYRVEVFKESKELANCYIIPLDGTILVNRMLHEVDSVANITHASKVEPGTSAGFMVIYKANEEFKNG